MDNLLIDSNNFQFQMTYIYGEKEKVVYDYFGNVVYYIFCKIYSEQQYMIGFEKFYSIKIVSIILS